MAGLLDRMWSDPSGQALTALAGGLLGVRRGNEGAAIQNALRTYNLADEGRRRNEFVDLQRKQVEMQMKRQQQQMADEQAFRSALTDPSILSPGQPGVQGNEMDVGQPAIPPAFDQQRLIQTFLRSGNPALVQKAIEMSQAAPNKGVVVGKSLVNPLNGQRIYRDDDDKDQWEQMPEKSSGGQLLIRNRMTGEVKAVGSGPQTQIINSVGGGTGMRPPTKMETKFDELAAKELSDWALGGSADAKKQIATLKRITQRLTPTSDLTGGWVGVTPDKVLPYTNSAAADAKDNVEEVVTRNLRLILGAQFTEKEGARLIARAYNPALKPEQNKVRLDALMRQMEAAAQAKDDATAYFEQNGTLQGWRGKKPSIDDFYDAIDNAGAVGGKVTGGATLRYNPQTKKLEPVE